MIWTRLQPNRVAATELNRAQVSEAKKATADYEGKMFAAFREAHHVLKERALITVVYPHQSI